MVETLSLDNPEICRRWPEIALFSLPKVLENESTLRQTMDSPNYTGLIVESSAQQQMFDREDIDALLQTKTDKFNKSFAKKSGRVGLFRFEFWRMEREAERRALSLPKCINIIADLLQKDLAQTVRLKPESLHIMAADLILMYLAVDCWTIDANIITENHSTVIPHRDRRELIGLRIVSSPEQTTWLHKDGDSDARHEQRNMKWNTLPRKHAVRPAAHSFTLMKQLRWGEDWKSDEYRQRYQTNVFDEKKDRLMAELFSPGLAHSSSSWGETRLSLQYIPGFSDDGERIHRLPRKRLLACDAP
jgi:hypothetical protein